LKTDVAAEMSRRVIEIMGLLDSSVHFVQENCTEEEFKVLRLSIGKVMGKLVIEVMNPLYANNPEVKPPEYEDYE
jgi:hypothetical protein